MDSYIRNLRTTKQYSVEEVAKAIGKSKAYVYDLESGRRKGTVETLHSLADYYNVDFEELCNHQSKRKETA